MLDKKEKYPVGVKSIKYIPEEQMRFELHDKYGHTCGVPILQYGLDSGYDLVYKSVPSKSGGHLWVPVGTVSRDWQPVNTSDLVNDIRTDLEKDNLLADFHYKLPNLTSKSTTHKAVFTLDRAIEMSFTPRDRHSDFVRPGNQNDTKEVYLPNLVLWNGYSGCCGLRAQFGLFRLICENGLIIPALAGSIRNLHTRQSAHEFIERFKDQNWSAVANKLKMFVQHARSETIDKDQMDLLLPRMTKSDVLAWERYPDHSANGMLNFLSFQQTHNATLSTEARYQSIINTVSDMVAA